MCNKCGCIQDIVSCDVAAIDMKVKLSPSSNFFYTITTRNGKIITKPFTTDINGNWEIKKEDLPEDFLSEGTNFKVEVTENANDGLPLNMLMTMPINCIDVEVKCIEGETKDFIGW